MSRYLTLTSVLACLLANTVFCSSHCQAQVRPGVDGRNVVVAQHGQGEFMLVSPGRWKAIRNGRVRFFREQARDAWSVYLIRDNGVRIQIDLWKKKIILTSGRNPRELFTIHSARSVYGKNVAYAGHANGSFTKVGPGRWKEMLNGRVGFFTEQGRDAWSVYLVKDNGVRVQIDLWKNRIYQLVPGGQRELYTIQGASS